MYELEKNIDTTNTHTHALTFTYRIHVFPLWLIIVSDKMKDFSLLTAQRLILIRHRIMGAAYEKWQHNKQKYRVAPMRDLIYAHRFLCLSLCVRSVSCVDTHNVFHTTVNEPLLCLWHIGLLTAPPL